MSESKKSKIEQLLEMPSNQVQNWLKDIWSGKTQIEADFNWLGFAEVAGFIAQTGEKNEGEPDIEWAKIATSIYDWLAATTKVNDTSTESFSLSSMVLRAYMINKFGSVSGHPVLDPNHIIRWLKESLVFSVEEATELAKMWSQSDINWKHQNVKIIRELRRIKNRLARIKSLIDGGKFIPDEEIMEWLSLREKLP